MTYELVWQLPTRGDARYGDGTRRLRGERPPGERFFSSGVSDPRGRTFNYFDHLHQIARAAELASFDAIRVTHDPDGDDAFIVAGYIARGTRALRIILELEASWGSAVYAAKNAVSFQRYTGGRLGFQVVRGPSESERRRRADPVPDDLVLARIDEMLTVVRGVITEAPFSFTGSFFEVENGGFKGTLSGHPVPRIYLGGDTDEAHDIALRHADVHVLPFGTPAQSASQITRVRARRAGGTRSSLGFGVRVALVARETSAEARRDASWLVPVSDAPHTLVGSYEEIVAQLAGLADVGVTSFLLSAEPHLEEAYRVGTHVLPALRERLRARRTAA